MKPSTNWKETILADEADRFEGYAKELQHWQRQRAKSGTVNRGLHAKGTANIEAEFTVLPNLPDHARVGLFSTPATYRAYARFSNGSPAHQADKKPDIRGVAVKLVGVAGRKIIPGMEDAQTQDFLLIRSASIPFQNADQFVGLVRARAKPATLLPWLFRTFGVMGALRLVPKLAKSVTLPIHSLASIPYFSALPIKYGSLAVHYALSPTVRDEVEVGKHPSVDYLREELAQRLRKGRVSYDFRVQFYVDDVRTPIEDASVEWKESDAPFLTVARLTLLQQDLDSDRGQRIAGMIEKMSFDPWHATEDFRPLGNMMRARNHAYRLSTQARGAAPEPDGTELV